jgi:hypothetical protein
MSKLMSNFLVFQLKLEQTIIDPGIDVSNKLRKIEKMESLLPSSGNTKMGACGCHGCFFFAKLFPTWGMTKMVVFGDFGDFVSTSHFKSFSYAWHAMRGHPVGWVTHLKNLSHSGIIMWILRFHCAKSQVSGFFRPQHLRSCPFCRDQLGKLNT